MEASVKNEDFCCPEFHPQPWDETIHHWERKSFISDRVITFLYMPVNFGAVMRRLDRLTRTSGAVVPENLCLSDHRNPFIMDLFLATDMAIEGARNTTLSGKIFSKVFEGPFKDTGKWMDNFRKTLADKGHKAEKIYTWYTTCPKCARKYGKNYVVMLAKLEI